MIAVFVPGVVKHSRGWSGKGTEGNDEGDGAGIGYGFGLFPSQVDGTGYGHFSYRRRGNPVFSAVYSGPTLLKESTWFTSVYRRL